MFSVEKHIIDRNVHFWLRTAESNDTAVVPDGLEGSGRYDGGGMLGPPAPKPLGPGGPERLGQDSLGAPKPVEQVNGGTDKAGTVEMQEAGKV